MAFVQNFVVRTLEEIFGLGDVVVMMRRCGGDDAVATMRRCGGADLRVLCTLVSRKRICGKKEFIAVPLTAPKICPQLKKGFLTTLFGYSKSCTQHRNKANNV